MRKKYNIIIVCMMITLSLSLILMCACNKKQKIEIVSVVSGKSYSLGIKPDSVHLGGDFCTFSIDLSLDKIQERLKEKGEMCQSFNDNFLIITKNISKTRKDYFIIGRLNDRNYQFMSAVAYDIESGKYVLFPIHLLSITASSFSAGEVYSFETNVAYELNSNKEMVKSFYEDIGFFLVEEYEKCLKIRLMTDDFMHKHIIYDFSVIFVEDNQKLSIKIQKEKQ